MSVLKPPPADGAPWVRAVPPVDVLVDHEGRQWPGQALAWQGQRVTVTFTVGMGLRHLMVVPASSVTRPDAAEAS